MKNFLFWNTTANMCVCEEIKMTVAFAAYLIL
jgi:hypothetical protein